MACTGSGDRDGGHCCWVDGVECEVLVRVDGVPRCPFLLTGEPMLGNPAWEKLPVGRLFLRDFPGFDCRDYPQNMPEIMGNPTAGKCCYGGDQWQP